MSIRHRLEQDLVDAMRERSGIEVKTIRVLLSAIENAAAVAAPADATPRVGLGHDVPRIQLTTEEVLRVIGEERDELAEAAATYRRRGQDTHAEELERRVSIVDRYLTR